MKRGHTVALNIDNVDTCRLIRELAKETGETMTEAVTWAVRERLDGVRQQKKSTLADRLLQIGKDCAKHLTEPYRSIEHGDLLYSGKRVSPMIPNIPLATASRP